MNKKSFFQQLKRPKGWWLFTVYFFTTVSIAGAIGVLFIEYTGTPFAYFAYALFALAGCTLTYSVYTFVLYFPPFKRKLIDRLYTWKFTSKLLQNYGFRTVIFSAVSLALSIAYAAYNVVVALLFKTMWYGALATYYVLLVALRAGIALYHGKRRGKERDGLLELKKYRNCGILLIVTILALSFAILKMVSENAISILPTARCLFSLYKPRCFTRLATVRCLRASLTLSRAHSSACSCSPSACL